MPPEELLAPAKIPSTKGLNTNGALAIYSVEATNSLLEINKRMELAREYRAECIRKAQEYK